MISSDLALIILFVSVLVSFYFLSRKKKWNQPKTKFPDAWMAILVEKVTFYKDLDLAKRQHFEYKVQEFLLNHKIIVFNWNRV